MGNGLVVAMPLFENSTSTSISKLCIYFFDFQSQKSPNLVWPCMADEHEPELVCPYLCNSDCPSSYPALYANNQVVEYIHIWYNVFDIMTSQCKLTVKLGTGHQWFTRLAPTNYQNGLHHQAVTNQPSEWPHTTSAHQLDTCHSHSHQLGIMCDQSGPN
jgi:hypothetical protein